MSHKLLLADDSVTIQRVIELTFADEDIEVTTVGDGQEAVEWLETTVPDVVLVDVSLPKRDGYELATHIKSQPQLAPVPVVLLTGAFEPVDEVKAAQVGCDDILSKPFEPQIVIDRVKKLLGVSVNRESSASAASELSLRVSGTPSKLGPPAATSAPTADAARGADRQPAAAMKPPVAPDARPDLPPADTEAVAASSELLSDGPEVSAEQDAPEGPENDWGDLDLPTLTVSELGEGAGFDVPADPAFELDVLAEPDAGAPHGEPAPTGVEGQASAGAEEETDAGELSLDAYFDQLNAVFADAGSDSTTTAPSPAEAETVVVPVPVESEPVGGESEPPAVSAEAAALADTEVLHLTEVTQALEQMESEVAASSAEPSPVTLESAPAGPSPVTLESAPAGPSPVTLESAPADAVAPSPTPDDVPPPAEAAGTVSLDFSEMEELPRVAQASGGSRRYAGRLHRVQPRIPMLPTQPVRWTPAPLSESDDLDFSDVAGVDFGTSRASKKTAQTPGATLSVVRSCGESTEREQTPPAASTEDHPAPSTEDHPAERGSVADLFAELLAAEKDHVRRSVPSEPTPQPAPPVESRTQERSEEADADPDAELVEQVSRKVLAALSDKVVRETVSEMVSEVTERLVREEIQRLKDEAQ